jgi:hypothetical protein
MIKAPSATKRGTCLRDIDQFRGEATFLFHSKDFSVFFATSIKARSFGAKEARRG